MVRVDFQLGISRSGATTQRRGSESFSQCYFYWDTKNDSDPRRTLASTRVRVVFHCEGGGRVKFHPEATQSVILLPLFSDATQNFTLTPTPIFSGENILDAQCCADLQSTPAAQPNQPAIRCFENASGTVLKTSPSTSISGPVRVNS